MKILHLTPRYYPAIGGAEKYMQIISEHLAKKHKVEIWTSNAKTSNALWELDQKLEANSPDVKETHNSVKIKRFNINPFPIRNNLINKGVRIIGSKIPIKAVKQLTSLPTTWGMFNQVKMATDYDYVHVSPSSFNFLFYIAEKVTKKSSARLIITPFLHLGINENDPIRKKYLQKESLIFYKKAYKIIVQTNYEKEQLQKFALKYNIKLKDKQFTKLGMGITPKEITGGNKKRFYKKYKLKPDTKIVFYVGSRTEDKGVITLIKAMKRLWKKNLNVKLVLAGGVSKGFKEFWKNQPKIVKENTIDLGYVKDKDKLDLFATGDIFSMVSKSDSFGIVYLESWINKSPVIGCKIPAIKEIITEKKDGFLVQFDDVTGLAKKIEKLVLDDALRNKLGNNGYKKVINNFTWDKKLDIINSIYEEI